MSRAAKTKLSGASPAERESVRCDAWIDALEKKWRDRATELIVQPKQHLYHKGMIAAYGEVLNALLEARESASPEEPRQDGQRRKCSNRALSRRNHAEDGELN